jgi:hypothetical protein
VKRRQQLKLQANDHQGTRPEANSILARAEAQLSRIRNARVGFSPSQLKLPIDTGAVRGGGGDEEGTRRGRGGGGGGRS